MSVPYTYIHAALLGTCVPNTAA